MARRSVKGGVDGVETLTQIETLLHSVSGRAFQSGRGNTQGPNQPGILKA